MGEEVDTITISSESDDGVVVISSEAGTPVKLFTPTKRYHNTLARSAYRFEAVLLTLIRNPSDEEEFGGPSGSVKKR